MNEEVLDQLKQSRAILQQKDVVLQQKEREVTCLRDIIKRMSESQRAV